MTIAARPLASPLARPALAYVLVIAADAAVFVTRRDSGIDGRVSLESGLWVLALLAVASIPAMVVTMELAHRSGRGSRIARSILGAAAWAGWCLVVAGVVASLSSVVLLPGKLTGVLVAAGVSGAAFGLLGLGPESPSPGRFLIASALAVTALVVIGSFLMAGHWGGVA